MYVATQMLGKGSFATVFKVRGIIDDKDYAAKCYYKEDFETSENKTRYVVIHFPKCIEYDCK